MKTAKTILVTGGSGFFGGLLKNRLLDEGHRVVNLDLVAGPVSRERLTSILAVYLFQSAARPRSPQRRD
jgi:nucleoside-diphosphate-sugar epimerase